MMRRFMVIAVGLAGLCLASDGVLAQGTKLWTVGRYEELERGSTEGVAIRNDGRLEAAPATSLVYTSAGNYVWSVAGDAGGNAYVGTGGTSSGSATVMRVGADGKALKIFEGKELGVQAVRVGGDGAVYVATSPDGKVYRVTKDGGPPLVVFDPASTEEKSKYIWDMAVGKAGEMYVAAGAPAAVYRVAGGKTELLYKTADQHIRCLLMSKSGMLWAGTDGGGVVYRVDPKQAGAKPFAMYAAAQREITALAEDEAGNVYASAVGSKTGTSLPPLPVTGAVGITVTFVQPGSTGAVSGSALVPDGSELYRIAADGTPSRLLSMKEDVVYGLAVRDGALIATTGNRGRVYRVDLATAGRFADVAHLEASQGTALATTTDGGLLIGTSNSGKLYKLGGAAKTATYTSEVFDAGGYTRWGRAEVRAEGTSYSMFVRVGNIPSTVQGWSDWVKLDGGAGKVPDGRYAQWKVELGGGQSGVEAVGLNYLPRNVAPVVDDVAVQMGARIAPGTGAVASTTVQVAFPAAPATGMTTGFTLPTDPGTGPITGQKDRTAVTVRWSAHDDNGDDMMFAVWCRGIGEKNFRLLKDKISDRFYSFDAVTLPDGPYVLKVVASDGPSHPDPETLAGERVSGVLVVDTTAPVVSGLKAALTPGGKNLPLGSRLGIEASFDATDATSPISHAEYSLDAGPWEYVEPEGKLSDGMKESYRFTVSVTALVQLAGQSTGNVAAGSQDSSEHVLAVRVYDRFENVGVAEGGRSLKASAWWPADVTERALLLFDLTGVFVFAVEGALAAVRAGLDVFGVLVLAFATALGGGLLRDLLIGAVPPKAICDWRYGTTALTGGAAVICFSPLFVGAPVHLMLVLDAAGLALCAVAGATKALEYRIPGLLATLMGVLTGVGGGTLRDLMLARVPNVLKADIYAVAALAGATVVVLGLKFGRSKSWAMIMGGVLCFALRMIAVTRGWNLPHVGLH